MSATDEQRRAAEAYRQGQTQRDSDDLRLQQDNARINGAATGGNGGAR